MLRSVRAILSMHFVCHGRSRGRISGCVVRGSPVPPTGAELVEVHIRQGSIWGGGASYTLSVRFPGVVGPVWGLAHPPAYGAARMARSLHCWLLQYGAGGGSRAWLPAAGVNWKPGWRCPVSIAPPTQVRGSPVPPTGAELVEAHIRQGSIWGGGASCTLSVWFPGVVGLVWGPAHPPV